VFYRESGYFSEAVAAKGWPPPDVFYLWYYVCTMELREDIEFMNLKLNVT